MRWSVVVPVKRLAVAKSRLRGALPGLRHEDLVLAMALDTVAAALVCPSVVAVLVVTDDPVAADALGRGGALTVPDSPNAGLNAALEHGARGAVAGTGVAALGADLPALDPGALSEALAGVEGRAFVADTAGTGTTLLAAAPGVPLGPRFGPDSAARHAASGATALAGAWPSLRRDVDTAADLAEALVLGVGAATAAVNELSRIRR